MLMSVNQWIKSFLNAWEMLIDIPLPAFFDNDDYDDSEKEELLACFPIVGFVIGMSCYIIAWIILIFSPSNLAAAIIGAIVITLLLEFVATTGTIAKLATYVTLKSEKSDPITIHTALEEGTSINNTPNPIFFLSLYLLKLFSIALLIYENQISWLIILFTMSYLVRSQMATWKDLRDSQPIIEIENPLYATKIPWIIAILISLFVAGFAYFPAVVVIAIVAFFLLKYFDRVAKVELGGITAPIIGVAGTATEIVFLLIGIALLLR